MNSIKKVVYGLLLYSCFITNLAQANNHYNQFGRTNLINCVIDCEDELAQIKHDIQHLWHTCYHYVDVVDGYATTKVDDNRSVSKPIYKQKLERRPSCTDADIHALKQREHDIRYTLDMTIKNLRAMVLSGERIDAKDYKSNTVINYCYTREIYNELRRLGAPFQILVWTYFYPEYATLAALGTVVLAGGTVNLLTHR